MPAHKKVSDEQIAESYRRLNSVWKVGDELGVCGQSVHERLVKLGMNNRVNVFTSEDDNYLKERYVIYRDAGKLQDLADEMGRTKPFICRQARRLGLTDPHHKARWLYTWQDIPECVARPIWEQFKRSSLCLSDFCSNRGYDVQHFVDTMNKYYPDEYDMVIESKGNRDTARARGMDFEFETQKDLKKHGYCALRSSASKSPADVYAFRYGEMVFVQCKINGVFNVDEWNDFYDYANSVGALPVMAVSGRDGSGVGYYRITGLKSGKNNVAQPMVEWTPTVVQFDLEEEY